MEHIDPAFAIPAAIILWLVYAVMSLRVRLNESRRENLTLESRMDYYRRIVERYQR